MEPVRRSFEWTYSVDPYGFTHSTYAPADATGVGELMRGETPQVMLPWTPASYPAVGTLPPGLGAAAAPAAAINTLESPPRVKARRSFASRNGG